MRVWCLTASIPDLRSGGTDSNSVTRSSPTDFVGFEVKLKWVNIETNTHLGVVQLIERFVWAEEAGSLSLPTQTT